MTEAGSVAPVFRDGGYDETEIYDFYHALIHNNKLYFCRQDGTIGHEPQESSDEYWFLSLDGNFADAASLGGETAEQWQAKINNLLNGTTPAGDSEKLGGKGAREYALLEQLIEHSLPYTSFSGKTVAELEAFLNNYSADMDADIVYEFGVSGLTGYAITGGAWKINGYKCNNTTEIQSAITYTSTGVKVISRSKVNNTWSDWSDPFATTSDLTETELPVLTIASASEIITWFNGLKNNTISQIKVNPSAKLPEFDNDNTSFGLIAYKGIDGYSGMLALTTKGLYENNAYNGTWSGWKNVSDGGNADTVDGFHASEFLLKTGGKITNLVIGQNSQTGAPGFRLEKNDGTVLGYLGLSADGTLKLWDSSFNMKTLATTADLVNKLDKTGGELANNKQELLSLYSTLYNTVFLGFKGVNGLLGRIGFVEKDNPVFYTSDASNVHALLHSGNISEHALPKSGGRITDSVGAPLQLENTTADIVGIDMHGLSGYLGWLGLYNMDTPAFVPHTGGFVYPLLHFGNIAEHALLKTDRSITGAVTPRYFDNVEAPTVDESYIGFKVNGITRGFLGMKNGIPNYLDASASDSYPLHHDGNSSRTIVSQTPLTAEGSVRVW